MIIDMHVHYVPDDVAELLRRRRTPPFIERLPDGTEQRVMPAGNRLDFTADYTDMVERIAFMDELGVDKQVLSMGLLFGLHALPIAESIVIARSFNDDLSGLCRQNPDRFSGMALLPMADIDIAVAEYRRARSELGLMGAILPVNSFTSRAEADKLVPLFDTAQEIGGHMFVHPGVRPDEFPNLPRGRTEGEKRDQLNERMALDVQNKLAHAMVTLSFSDFLAPYPDVTVQLANLGGTLPIVLERMDNVLKIRSPGDELASQRLGRVFLDCASLGPRAIEIAVKTYGPDRLVLGTDYPIFQVAQSLAAIEAADIDVRSKGMLLSDNAGVLVQGA